MQVRFYVAGGPKWDAELESLDDHIVINEYRRMRDVAVEDKKIEIVWVERNYLGRISEGPQLKGRFWRVEPDFRAVRKPVRSSKWRRACEKVWDWWCAHDASGPSRVTTMQAADGG